MSVGSLLDESPLGCAREAAARAAETGDQVARALNDFVDRAVAAQQGQPFDSAAALFLCVGGTQIILEVLHRRVTALGEALQALWPGLVTAWLDGMAPPTSIPLAEEPPTPAELALGVRAAREARLHSGPLSAVIHLLAEELATPPGSDPSFVDVNVSFQSLAPPLSRVFAAFGQARAVIERVPVGVARFVEPPPRRAPPTPPTPEQRDEIAALRAEWDADRHARSDALGRLRVALDAEAGARAAERDRLRSILATSAALAGRSGGPDARALHEALEEHAARLEASGLLLDALSRELQRSMTGGADDLN